MKLRTLVNTDTPMSQQMLEALTEFEFSCIPDQIKETTPEQVAMFLLTNHGQELASQFTPDMMYAL